MKTSTTTPRQPFTRSLTIVLAAFALVLAACSSEPIPISAPVVGESAAATDQGAASLVATADSDLGPILVNAAGLSIYGFTNDVDGLSACDGGCANAWPPILVPSAQLPADLDPNVFSVIQRNDGTNQLKAGKWPLYLFAGDTAAGQTTGHLSGDVWFLASPDGSLIGVPPATEAVAAPAQPEASAVEAPAVAAQVSVAPSSLGDILVNDSGLTLYGFTNDVDGIPTCEGGCADAWPPILVPTSELPVGLDPNVFSVIQRTDGQMQLKAGKWPLYLFAGDTAAGQTTGHLSGDVWFVVSPTGALIDAPAPAEPADQAETAADESASDDQATSDDGYGSGDSSASEAAVAVASASTVSDFGEVLVDEQGRSLYGFTNDVDGISVCDGACADAWPPVLVPTAELPVGLDASVFSVVARADGQWQLKAGKWPLYRFAGDTGPGETTGHLSGNVWFLASPTGSLIGATAFQPAQPAPTAVPVQPTPVPTAQPAPTPTPVPVQPTPTPNSYSSDY